MRKILSLLFLIVLRSNCWSAEYDVCVYGGTPGGITAAISAAREGASVVLLEQTRHVGGLTTSGLNRDECNHLDRQTLGGLCEQFIEEAVKRSKGRWTEGLLPSDQMSPCPVVIKVNDYTVGLFNGDDGICLGQRAYFGAEDGNREVAISRLPSHQLGYAMSIHRSQGSEFDRVLIVLPATDAKLLTRELLYVAVSRAKAGIILLGSEDSLIGAIQRSEESCSGVYDLLKRML